MNHAVDHEADHEVDHDDRALLADLDATFEAANRFFPRFNEIDWARAHGSEWVFADVPYHLAIYNRMIANGILKGENADLTALPAIINLTQLNHWNQANMRAIRANAANAEGLIKLHDSQEMLRGAVATMMKTPKRLDSPVWLMTLRVRGWRTARLAVEYIQWHTWLHLAEAGLRYDDRHPIIAPAALRRALDFNIELTAGAVDPAKAVDLLRDKPFRWSLELRLPESGTAAWTLVIDPARYVPQKHALHHDIENETEIVEILPHWTDDADVTMRADLAMYLKISQFSMVNPAIAALTGKVRIKGVGKINRLTQLFNATPEQTWMPMARGRAIRL